MCSGTHTNATFSLVPYRIKQQCQAAFEPTLRPMPWTILDDFLSLHKSQADLNM